MRALFATLVSLASLGPVGSAQADLLVGRSTEAIGDKPSTVAEYRMPQSGLADDANMPRSHLDAAAPGGSLGEASGSSGFALSNMNSQLREETVGLLTELNAKQQEDGSILVAVPGDVLFDFDKSDIRADAQPVLDQLVRVLINASSPRVEISGHTDSMGSEEYNQSLSEQRAISVSAYLSSHGVEAANLVTIGKGESEPVAPNETRDGKDDPAGRQTNRRVEFVIAPTKAE
ncbi:OmpA family protein [Devosia sp. A16]|uniref:OmpA family protein n=1 Tax=Devosia sp. A16 TaxID=1736675 RepID=UPI0006D79A8A|nr:OmpA family protein [Devosia sp. A16]